MNYLAYETASLNYLILMHSYHESSKFLMAL